MVAVRAAAEAGCPGRRQPRLCCVRPARAPLPLGLQPPSRGSCRHLPLSSACLGKGMLTAACCPVGAAVEAALRPSCCVREDPMGREGWPGPPPHRARGHPRATEPGWGETHPACRGTSPSTLGTALALRRGPGLLCAVPTSGAAVLALQAQRPDGRSRPGQRRRGTRAVRARCSGGSPGACGGPCRAVWPRAGSRRERQVQQELGGQKAEGGASWDVPTGAAMGVLHIRASSTPSSSMAPQNVDPWTLRSDVQARATQTRDGTWTRGPAFLPVPRGDPEPRGQAAPCIGCVFSSC